MMNQEKNDRISILLFKQIAGQISTEEAQELKEWRESDPRHEELYSRLTNTRMLEQEYLRRQLVDYLRPQKEMQERIRNKRIHGRRTRLVGWSIAASVTILSGIGLLQFFSETESAPLMEKTPTLTFQDIRPGSTTATLILSDGQKVKLGADSATNARTLAFCTTLPADYPEKSPQLTLDVPRGGEFKITLEDSTEVWLNSESRLIYPESFSREERRVTVTGEAFFRVAHDPERPFYVETGGQQIRVYGTEFNIRSYTDDPNIYTTLVNGSISLCPIRAEKSGELLLAPGHQAVFDKKGQDIFVKPVNTEVVTSWREGRFVFEEQTLEQIMNILGRWYNFKYRFEDDSLAHIEFMGSIPRYSQFTTALHILEKSGGLKFSIEDHTVIISSKP